MSKIFKCDCCGQLAPRSIRRIIAENPDVNVNEPLNNSRYYAFNLFTEDLCETCLHDVEMSIAKRIRELREEHRNGKK